MKKIRNIFLYVIALAMIFPTVAFASGEKAIVISYSNQKNGFFVSTFENRDFPTRADLTKNEYIFQVNVLLDTAEKYGYNTIYFDAISFGQASFKSKVLPINQWITSNSKAQKSFDPLEILTEKAKQRDILVVATVDPFSFKESAESPYTKENLYVKEKGFTYINYQNKSSLDILLKAVREVATNYDINGILLTNPLDKNLQQNSSFAEISENIISNIYKTVKQVDPTLSIGLQFDGANVFNNNSLEFINNTANNSDYLVVNMDYKVDSGYSALVEKWSAICEENEKGLFINNSISKYLAPTNSNYFISDFAEIHKQIYLNTQNKVNGTILDSYKSILLNINSVADDLAIVASNSEIYGKSIENNEHKLGIALPNSYGTTDQNTFIITGTSDPSLDLFVNDMIVPNQNKDGYFLFEADVADGENEFVFSQSDGSEKTVIIEKTSTDATKNPNHNPFPKFDEPIVEGQTATLSITAPKGIKVCANFNNTIYKMVQTQYENNMATYTAKVLMPYISGENSWEALGNIVYSISDGEKVYNKKSSGQIIIVDKKIKVKGDIKNFDSNVYSYAKDTAPIVSTLKEGATDYIEEISGDFVLFGSMGYVHRKDIEINCDGISAINNVINIALTPNNKSDVFTIVGTKKSPCKITRRDKTIVLELYNVVDIPESLAHLKSDLFDNIYVDITSSTTASLIFELKDNSDILGFDVSYENENIVVEFIHKPKVSTSNLKPLSGLDILIDAGGGGTNANGVSPDGTSVGEINLYMAYMLNHRLKALGANVFMTRTSDELLPIY
ncbi:MAG: hypothetical protein RR048_04920, partial [Oscillospiraceae bacterium]